MYFATGSTTASRVYGQGGNFATDTVNEGGISATSLYYPSGVTLDKKKKKKKKKYFVYRSAYRSAYPFIYYRILSPFISLYLLFF